MALRNVPIFLAFGLLLLGLAACGLRDGEATPPKLSPEEEFWVEQYLRIVEVRMMAAEGDSLADGRFNFLGENLPADSLLAITESISERDPERWSVIFEEIVRRKKIMESRPR